MHTDHLWKRPQPNPQDPNSILGLKVMTVSPPWYYHSSPLPPTLEKEKKTLTLSLGTKSKYLTGMPWKALSTTSLCTGSETPHLLPWHL